MWEEMNVVDDDDPEAAVSSMKPPMEAVPRQMRSGLEVMVMMMRVLFLFIIYRVLVFGFLLAVWYILCKAQYAPSADHFSSLHGDRGTIPTSCCMIPQLPPLRSPRPFWRLAAHSILISYS